MGENNHIMEALIDWQTFKKEILYTNRFHIEHRIFDRLQVLAKKREYKLKSGDVLYRARLYNIQSKFTKVIGKYKKSNTTVDNEMLDLIKIKEQTDFWGFDEQDSFVPPENVQVNHGRVNPSYIRYLYTAERPYTAMVEVRPYLESKISIAEIKVLEDLKLVDLTDEWGTELEDYYDWLSNSISNDFMRPSDYKDEIYIPLQCISEYFKSLGYDGIRFKSSLDKEGINVTIFNYEKCKPVNSKLYELHDICFEAYCMAPENIDDLYNRKLKFYRDSIGISNFRDIESFKSIT